MYAYKGMRPNLTIVNDHITFQMVRRNIIIENVLTLYKNNCYKFGNPVLSCDCRLNKSVNSDW